MAASKAKKVAPKKSAASAKKAPAAPKRAPSKPSVAVQVLGTLPALNGKLRAAYRAAFSDEQCLAWGDTTKAADVLKQSESWIPTLAGAVKKLDEGTYSARRLAYLCELTVLLQDEIAATTGSTGRTGVRESALAVAQHAREGLIRRLRALAGGRAAIHDAVAKAAVQNPRSPSEIQESLTELIALATRLRRDDVTEALADDVGLSESRLNAAYAALEALTGANQLSADPGTYEGDAPSVNLIEGRVLRELKVSQEQLAGTKLNVLPALKSVLAAG